MTKVRAIFMQKLASISDVCEVVVGNGAFYFLIKIKREINDFKLVKQLIEQYKVAVIPGGTFGIEQGCYLRVAYGNLSLEQAKIGITRLTDGLNRICG